MGEKVRMVISCTSKPFSGMVPAERTDRLYQVDPIADGYVPLRVSVNRNTQIEATARSAFKAAAEY